MPRVLVTEEIADRGLDGLRAAGYEVDVRLGLSAGDLLDAVKGAHALIIRSATDVTADVLAAGSDLVVVGRAGIGLDNVDLDAATRRGVMVVNAPQSNIVSAAEHTMALVLAQARNVPQAHAALKQGRWERSQWEGVELDGKTLGIVGLGRIGRHVAKIANAFGMRVLAWRRTPDDGTAASVGAKQCELDDLLRDSDVVTIHATLAPATRGLIDARRLALMKPTAYLINTARGPVVDEAALVAALAGGRLAGAGLDVFDVEPLPPGHPLTRLPNVVLTPHVGWPTDRKYEDFAESAVDVLLAYLDGREVPRFVEAH